MSLLISGSVAFDTIIQTVGKFSPSGKPNEDLHLSLFSPLIRKEYGGTAANIAYSLALLGKSPHVIASIGEDGNEYREKMSEMGIHTELIKMVPGSYCPQAYIIRDEGSGQINTFHPGAMSISGELTHGNTEFSHAIVAPDSKEGMMRRVDECSSAGIFTIFDPGQAMGIFTGEELRQMATKADMTIMNEPEREQFASMVGEDVVSICQAFGHTAIITLGEKGSIIESQSSKIEIPDLYSETVVDATGCGDAFRAGLLYGLSEGWDMRKSGTLGSILGGIKIASMGGQNHSLDKSKIDELGEKQFGIKFFD